MDKNKIVFLINSLSSGGAEKIVLTLVKKLILDKNKNIEIICLEKNNFYEVPKELKITYLTNTIGKSNGILKLLQLPYLAYKLKNYTKENNISIIQSHLYRANYINIISSILGSEHKTQIVNHGIPSRYKKKGFMGKINLYLIKKLYKRADKIILISKAMKKDLNKLYKFNNDQIIINNPYDINNINILKNEETSEFIFNINRRYIITVGRLISLKRFGDVIESLKFLDDKIELILLGEGEEKENLIKLSIQNKVNSRTHFLGNVENPFKFISKSDLFILPSETEGFPNSLIEALICKTPIISTDCISGPREILSPDTSIDKQLTAELEITKNGILYPIANINKLVEAIELSLNNNSSILNGYNRALDFSIDKIILNYKKVLEIE